MRVLHIGSSCGFGGAETVALTLIREQRKAGMEADAFFVADRGGAARFEGLCDVWFASRYSLTDIILGGRYDVLHIDAASSRNVAPALRQSLYKGAVILTSHGWWEGFLGSEYVTAVSRFGAEEMQPFCPTPVRVIRNGIDLSRFHPGNKRTEGKPIAAWVGRSSDAAKDSSVLLAMCTAGLLDGFETVIVDGSTQDVGIEEAWLPSGTRLTRLMPWADMPDFYRSVAESGGFLFSTSRVERCPMTMIEAQACGCPVIGPAVGGIPEVVRDRQTGFLYDRTKGPAAMREAIQRLYADGRWEELSRAAAQHIVTNFSEEKMFREYKALYDEAQAAHHPTYFNLAAQRLMAPVIAAVQPKRHLVRKKQAEPTSGLS